MKLDFIEAISNAAVGFAVSAAATRLVLGYDLGQSIAITVMFFGLSFARSYLLRIIFRRLA